jgi:hypothetical protein
MQQASQAQTDRATVAYTLQATAAWQNWVRRLANHLRLPRPVVIDHALALYAASKGFEEAPPQRTPGRGEW